MNRRLCFALSLWNFPCGCLRHFSWFIGFILTCILFLSSRYGNSHLLVFILFGFSELFVNIKGSFKLIPSISIFSCGRWFRG